MDAALLFIQASGLDPNKELLRPVLKMHKSMSHIERSPNAASAFPYVIEDFLAMQHCALTFVTERSGFGKYGLYLAGPPYVNKYVMKRHGVNELVSF